MSPCTTLRGFIEAPSYKVFKMTDVEHRVGVYGSAKSTICLATRIYKDTKYCGVGDIKWSGCQIHILYLCVIQNENEDIDIGIAKKNKKQKGTLKYVVILVTDVWPEHPDLTYLVLL